MYRNIRYGPLAMFLRQERPLTRGLRVSQLNRGKANMGAAGTNGAMFPLRGIIWPLPDKGKSAGGSLLPQPSPRKPIRGTLVWPSDEDERDRGRVKPQNVPGVKLGLPTQGLGPELAAFFRRPYALRFPW